MSLSRSDFEEQINRILDQELQTQEPSTKFRLAEQAKDLVCERVRTKSNGTISNCTIYDAADLVDEELDEIMRKRILRGQPSFRNTQSLVRSQVRDTVLDLKIGW